MNDDFVLRGLKGPLLQAKISRGILDHLVEDLEKAKTPPVEFH
jgi:hypothetical protein